GDGLARQERALDVDSMNAVDFRFFQRQRGARGGHTGDIDQRSDRACLAFDVGHERFDSIAIGHVTLHGVQLWMLPGHRWRYIGAEYLISIGEQALAYGRSEPARRASDECDAHRTAPAAAGEREARDNAAS